jgi:hypothetical protein
MNNRLGKKWLAVGVIWFIVLAMTGWNFHLVEQVQSRRRELGTLQMDLGLYKGQSRWNLERESTSIPAGPSGEILWTGLSGG